MIIKPKSYKRGRCFQCFFLSLCVHRVSFKLADVFSAGDLNWIQKALLPWLPAGLIHRYDGCWLSVGCNYSFSRVGFFFFFFFWTLTSCRCVPFEDQQDKIFNNWWGLSSEEIGSGEEEETRPSSPRWLMRQRRRKRAAVKTDLCF